MNTPPRILVVEDERIVAEDIRRSLFRLGYEVLGVVSTGAEALRCVRTLQPDLVLMDIMLRIPFNGITVAQKIREVYNIPVIYLTAYDDVDTLERAKKTEPYGYILKPFEERTLQTTIEMAFYKHRMEKELKEREMWFSTILRSLTEAVIVTNAKSEILFMNPAAQKMTGWKYEEIANRSFDEVFQVIGTHGNSIYPVKEIFRFRKPMHVQAEWVLRNDRKIHVEIHASPMRVERKEMVGAVVTFEDITQRKRTEEALRQSEWEKRLILTSVSESIQYLSSTFRIIWANETAGRMAGIAPEKLKGMRCYRIFGTRAKPCRRCPLEEALAKGQNTEMEVETRDGRFWFIKGYLVKNEKAKTIGMVEVIQDITEKKQVEEELQKERAFIHSLLQVSPAFYVALNAKGEILLLNETFLEALNVTKDDIVGKNFVSLIIHPEDQRAMSIFLRSLMKSQETVSIESRIVTPSHREVVVDWYGRTVYGKNGKLEYAFLLGLDITERKWAEKEKARIENQLFRIQKMEAIGTLTGGIAHDFNNLLTAIRGSAEMASLHLNKEHPSYRELIEIQNAVERATTLTRQLLLFSSRHPSRFVHLDLNRVISDLEKILVRLLGEDIRIETYRDSYLWSIRGDRATLEQVILNLAVNARDAMPKGGKLIIRTDNVVIDANYCALFPEARPGEFVRLAISDTGTGIAPDVLPHIFEPFFTTKSKGKGIGLGLSVVYGIVRQHSGWIVVNSMVGEGTTFEMYFPALKESVLPQEEEAEVFLSSSLEAFKGHGECILVVEDSDGVREFVHDALKQHGYQVYTAENGKNALRTFHYRKKKIDLVFVDVVLPDENGLHLLEKFYREKPELKCLLTSGYTDQKSQWPIIHQKKYPFLQKPFNLLQLLKAVHSALRR